MRCIKGQFIFYRALNTDIYKRFEKEGIKIAFPQRDSHIRSNMTDSPKD